MGDDTNSSDNLRRLLDSSNENLDSEQDEPIDEKPEYQTCLLDSRGERKSSILLDEYGGAPSDETLEVAVKNGDDEEEEEEISEDVDEDNNDDEVEEINKVAELAISKLINEATVSSGQLKKLSDIAQTIDQSLDKSEKAIEQYTTRIARFLKEAVPKEPSPSDADSGIEIDFIDVIDTDPGVDGSDNDSLLILDIEVPEADTSDLNNKLGTEKYVTEVLINSVTIPNHGVCQSEQIKDLSSSVSIIVQDSQALLTVSRDDVAQDIPPTSPVAVGSRVLAKFKGKWVLGVTAEPSKLTNRYRYLIFLNQGEAVYVKNEDLRTFLDVSESDLEVDGFSEQDQIFIKQYLETFRLNGYPETPFKRLKEGDIFKLNADDMWRTANVVEIDSSIMKVAYSNSIGRQEVWVFRGSYQIGGKTEAEITEATASNRCDVHDILNRKERGSFAKKSTTRKRPFETLATGTASTDVPSPAAADGRIIRAFHQPVPGLQFVPHDCTPACISRPEHNFNSGNVKVTGQILLIPLQWGWRRLVVKHSNNGFTKVLLRNH